ncbi:MAG: hypothetical protein EOP59_18360 [Sphingomonadales bacterium]|nr:MAG: hypothetical protein EOP59_18360 [Sphingomonadales bacterium]
MKQTTMRQIRRFHFYLGVFFAPAILLFALSGALQTFRLQEAKGYGGTPPSWIVWMASVHKDSRLPVEKTKPAVAAPAAQAAPAKVEAAPPPAVKKPNNLPLKIFVVLMAIGLALSAILGVTIALNTRATRRGAVAMLIAGSILPLLMLLL